MISETTCNFRDSVGSNESKTLNEFSGEGMGPDVVRPVMEITGLMG